MSGHSEAEDPQSFKIPISELQPEVIADILEFSEPQVRLFGTITERAARQVQGGASGRRGVLGDTATVQPRRAYSLQTLIDGLTEDDQGRFPLLPNITSQEKSTANALRAKLIHLGRSGMLDWNATNAVQELPVNDLVVGGRLSVLDVSE